MWLYYRLIVVFVFFFKQKTAYEMRISDWSSDVCSSRSWTAYHDFEGAALDAGEQPRIVRDIGDKRILILRNHGLLTVGKTMGEAFVWMYRIETACKFQIEAMAGDRKSTRLNSSH